MNMKDTKNVKDIARAMFEAIRFSSCDMFDCSTDMMRRLDDDRLNLDAVIKIIFDVRAILAEQTESVDQMLKLIIQLEMRKCFMQSEDKNNE